MKTKKPLYNAAGKEISTKDELDKRHETTGERIITVYLEDRDDKNISFRWRYNDKIVTPLQVYNIMRSIMRILAPQAKEEHAEEMRKKSKIIVVPAGGMPQA